MKLQLLAVVALGMSLAACDNQKQDHKATTTTTTTEQKTEHKGAEAPKTSETTKTEEHKTTESKA